MIFLKSVFVSTTKEVDFIPIIHDIRFAIQDSQIQDGLATITIPGSEAALLVSSEEKKALDDGKEKFQKPEGPLLSLTLPFQKRELILNPQQMIYLIDFAMSGKRREFYVHVFGETPQTQQQQQQTTGRRRP